MATSTKKATAKNVDEYVRSFPAEVRPILEKVRQTIKAAAPKASEVISYQIPAYQLNGMLVYFGAWKNHIGFYPTGRGIEAFKKELSVYEGAKGTVKFPLDRPVPFGLISKIVKYRVKENEKKLTLKKNNKPLAKKERV
jgi:uncharacterized protein YdhG (YjbR/CyaY superfamily)